MASLAVSSKTVPWGPLATAYLLKQAPHNVPDLEIRFVESTDAPLECRVNLIKATTTNAASRLLARHFSSSLVGGSGPESQAHVDYWLDFAADNLSADPPLLDFKRVSAAVAQLNAHLKMRSFLIGHSVTLADLSVWGALKGNAIFGRNFKASANIPHLTRWLALVSALPSAIAAVDAVQSAVTSARSQIKDQGNFDIPLPGATMGNVVTRFPPEPSGYLHIGHAKAALLNDYFAKMYNGKLIVRFDDTNPSKEKVEFEESIKEDLALIGIKGDKVSHTSDFFDKIHILAIEFIKRGKGYVDDTDQETMRAERMDGIESKARSQSMEESLRRFEEMRKGSEEGLKMCLRAKIDMQNGNKALRDPVMYRCNVMPHHLTGNKWKIYPTYDFACPIVDSLEGVTHALRTNEYRDRNPLYNWVLEALSLRKVHIWDYSRLNFVYTLLSKRKLAWFVENGHVTGWDDPRFPTVRGIRRRGMTIEALRQYILMQGASQATITLEWDKIWTLNKKIIDPVSPRYVAIDDERISVTVEGFKAQELKDMPKHKKNPDVGLKKTAFTPKFWLELADAKDLEVGEEVTLMDWGNVFITAVNKSSSGVVESLSVKLHIEGDFKKTKKKLTWLAQGYPKFEPISIILLDYDYLITKKKMDEDDSLESCLTPNTEFKTQAIGDANLKEVKLGEVIQFERKGYFICDKGYDASKPTEPMHFITIPDGKASSLTSKAANASSENLAKPEPKAKASKAANGVSVKEPGFKHILYPTDKIYPVMAPMDYSKINMYPINSIYKEFDQVFDAQISGVNKEPRKEKTGKEIKVDAKKTAGKENNPDKANGAAAALPEVSLISKLDIVVGQILSVGKHPDADTLYVEQIDVGEPEPRTVVSGLVKFMTEDQIKGKTILVLKNLKPAAMRGIKSHAMVLCASNDDHSKVEFLVPPPGSKPGDRVFFEGHEGEPETQLNPKKKIFEALQPDFSTDENLVARWKGIPFRTAKGIVKTSSIAKASIK